MAPCRTKSKGYTEAAPNNPKIMNIIIMHQLFEDTICTNFIKYITLPDRHPEIKHWKAGTSCVEITLSDRWSFLYSHQSPARIPWWMKDAM